MTRASRLLLGGGAALVLLALVASPASAHAPTGSWTSPPTPDEGARVDALPTIQGVFQHGDPNPTSLGIDHVTIVLTTADGREIPNGVREVPGDGAVTVPFTWPADELPIVWNGTYKVEASAVTRTETIPPHDAEEGTLPARSFLVAIPPATPTGLRASADASTGQASLAWNASPEPDQLGYVVERRGSDGGYAEIARFGPQQARAASGRDGLAAYVDRPPAAGDYSYRVVAVRCSGVYSAEGTCVEALESDKSPSVATTVVAPTTTTAPPGGITATTVTPTLPRGVDLSIFGALRNQARRSSPRPTEPDTGFSETLPFGKGDADQAGRSDNAQAAFRGEESSDADRRALLVPVAVALILFVFALQLRWLTHYVAETLPALTNGATASVETSAVLLGEPQQLAFPGMPHLAAAGHSLVRRLAERWRGAWRSRRSG